MLWGMSVDKNGSGGGKQAHLPAKRLQKGLDGRPATFRNVDEGDIIIKDGHSTCYSGFSLALGHGTFPFGRAWNPALLDNRSRADQ
jgi:hypothetical protein